ncbi:olfactory receptor 1020-like [Tachyglossus aculeatus]|uniref:olfactory receptor 1020-like n=1 Tax=Tachyglossus aculeatus TaxID=9261 RepID=UPI0018F73E6D|nr:olfactory receptor 1020-like [Tachyglossus aculeatus]
MAGRNQTMVTEFVLLGFTDQLDLQILLFGIFLVIYLITLIGNLGMMGLIRVSSRLHTPMYFFLSHLSFVDICYASSITPKILANIFVKEKNISFTGCFTQLYFSSALATTECFLLAAMAFDRFVAICNPLLYAVIMSNRVCSELAIAVYIYGFLNSLIQTTMTLQASFCDSNVINHFYCADPPLLSLSCSDIHVKEKQIFIISTLNLVSSLLVVFLSYCCIFVVVLKFPSGEDRCKAFSTCVTHLTVIALFYGTLFSMYFQQPYTNQALPFDKAASVFYSLIIPMLNPLIYSLRNRDVKEALRKVIERKVLR